MCIYSAGFAEFTHNINCYLSKTETTHGRNRSALHSLGNLAYLPRQALMTSVLPDQLLQFHLEKPTTNNA